MINVQKILKKLLELETRHLSAVYSPSLSNFPVLGAHLLYCLFGHSGRKYVVSVRTRQFLLFPVPTLSAGVVTRAYPPFYCINLRFSCHWVENLQISLKIMTKDKNKKNLSYSCKGIEKWKIDVLPTLTTFPFGRSRYLTETCDFGKHKYFLVDLDWQNVI